MARCLLLGAAVMSPHPHDALFKSAFESPGHAAALVRELLPTAIGEAISWDMLKGDSASFVDIVLADSHGDLLFSTRLRTGEPAFLYLLLEHQSTPDPAMPLRGLSYQIQIWKRFRKEQPARWLPPIIAAVISHAPGGWNTSRSLEEMFDPSVMAVPGVATLVPHFSLIIEDLAHRTDDELKARSLAAFPRLALWLLRDARDPERILRSFDAWGSTMLEAKQAPSGRDDFGTLVNYLFHVFHPRYEDELRAKIHQLDHQAKEIEMTIAEQLQEEGRTEGRIATLRSLMLFKFNLQTLATSDEARLLAATPATLDRYAQRVLTADSLAAVFED
jgi:hypothetical protein